MTLKDIIDRWMNGQYVARDQSGLLYAILIEWRGTARQKVKVSVAKSPLFAVAEGDDMGISLVGPTHTKVKVILREEDVGVLAVPNGGWRKVMNRGRG